VCWLEVLDILGCVGLKCWTFKGVLVCGAGHFSVCLFEVLDILGCGGLRCSTF